MFVASLLLCLAAHSTAPQPLVRWVLDENRIEKGSLRAIAGPDPEVSGFPARVESPWGPAMRLDHELETVMIPWFVRREWPQDPKEDFTATVAFRIAEARARERVAGCVFDNGDGLIGWQILVENGRPVLEIGHPKGRVRLTSTTNLAGSWAWVSAGYTGREAYLVVNGREAARAQAPFGPLPYAGRAPLAVSGYWHGRGSTRFNGDVREFRIDAPALPSEGAAALHANPQPVPPPPAPEPEPESLAWVIEPFLQCPREDQVTLSFETSRRTVAVVRHGPRANQLIHTERMPSARLHHVRLRGLRRGAPWFYAVSVTDAAGKTLTQAPTDFPTLPDRNQTLRFVVTADTQSSPERSIKVAAAMREHRPDFAVVVGDLVGEGWLMSNWAGHFFGSMKDLLRQVPLVPVVGNHERNARLYYLLMDAPEPEYYYRFAAGEVDFYSIDTEHPTDAKSLQYRWLERDLRASRARWKVAMHHYPAYSSGYDEIGSPTDFGGDSQARNLVPLYERYGLTTALSGHVHHYERTFPMLRGKVDEHGITYFTLGGGGGGLDRGSPAWRFDFSRNRRSQHHFALVTVSRDEFLVQVYDWDNHLFDEWRAPRPR